MWQDILADAWLWIQQYWYVVVVIMASAIKVWRDRKVREIIDAALNWLIQWAGGELDKVTEDDVRSAAGYFYDGALSYLPAPAQRVVKAMIPKDHVQDLAWEWWGNIIMPSQSMVMGY